MTKTTNLSLIFTVLLLGSGATAVQAASKVEVCHIPPDDPSNFHTITISENAFAAHLAHGDIGGPCDAACAALCDDGNACTIDDSGDCEQNGCPVSPEPVDCDDQNECTTDSCEPTTGCVNDANVGATCDDGAVCTGFDTCNALGECAGSEIDNCCLGDGDCSGDSCDPASCDTDTNRCVNDPVVCDPSDLCQISECASDTGACNEAPVVCGDAEVCNPSNGLCEPTAPPVACPCNYQGAIDYYVNVAGGLNPIPWDYYCHVVPYPGESITFEDNRYSVDPGQAKAVEGVPSWDPVGYPRTIDVYLDINLRSPPGGYNHCNALVRDEGGNHLYNGGSNLRPNDSQSAACTSFIQNLCDNRPTYVEGGQ